MKIRAVNGSSGYRMYKSTFMSPDSKIITKNTTKRNRDANVSIFIKACIKYLLVVHFSQSSPPPSKPTLALMEERLLASIVRVIVNVIPQQSPTPTDQSTLTNSKQDIDAMNEELDESIVVAIVIHQERDMHEGKTPNYDTMFLAGFQTVASMMVESLDARFQPVPYKIQSTLVCDLMKMDSVKTILAEVEVDATLTNTKTTTTTTTTTSSHHSQPSSQDDVDMNTENDNDNDSHGNDDSQLSMKYTEGTSSSSSLVRDITEYHTSPIYIFNNRPGQLSDVSGVNVLLFINEYRRVFWLYSRLFSEWKSAVHGYRTSVLSSFGPCTSLVQEFGKRCIKAVQYDSDGDTLFGSVEQAIKTSAAVLHTAVQAAAIMIQQQGDYGMVNWLAVCWGIHTRIRLTYAMYSSSFNHHSNLAVSFAATLGIPSRSRDAWLDSDAPSLPAELACSLCEDVATYNGIHSGIPVKIRTGEEDATSYAAKKEINSLLKRGVLEIYRAVDKYKAGFERVDEGGELPYTIPTYISTAYKEAINAYGGSCLSIAGVTVNPYQDFAKTRRLTEKSTRTMNETFPELVMAMPYTDRSFGFPLHDPCAEDGFDECHCQKVNWDEGFKEALGFNPPYQFNQQE